MHDESEMKERKESMKLQKTGRRLVAGLMGGLLAMGFMGCDQGGGHDELTISPEEQELSYNSETVRFTVVDGLRELSLPLEWTVSNPGLGKIVAHEGTNAIYRRYAAGVNIVTVMDQYRAEGIAAVTSPGSVPSDDRPPRGDKVWQAPGEISVVRGRKSSMRQALPLA